MGELTPPPRPGLALVVNAGSTSLKAAVFADDASQEPLWAINVDDATIGTDRVAGFEQALGSAPKVPEITVVGHRVVHGGQRFDRPILIAAEVEAAITAMQELAPRHNRAALDGIAAARRVVAPEVPHVAVFDTAFHRGLPTTAAAYGGPHRWLDQGLRRYGFHGISHEHAAHTAAMILRRPLESLRLVTCHLGGGCSLAAIDRGRSIFHLLRSGTPLDELQYLLEECSGLLGLSGISADLREVITARDAGDERAALAVDVFIHRVATGVGAMIAALGGTHAIVFTGGIAEHSPEVRARVSDHFAFLGVTLDEDRNQANPVDADLSGVGATVPVLVVRAREELAIAREAFRVVAR